MFLNFKNISFLSLKVLMANNQKIDSDKEFKLSRAFQELLDLEIDYLYSLNILQHVIESSLN